MPHIWVKPKKLLTIHDVRFSLKDYHESLTVCYKRFLIKQNQSQFLWFCLSNQFSRGVNHDKKSRTPFSNYQKKSLNLYKIVEI